MRAKVNKMTKRALIAGISAYPDDPLAYCVDDALSMNTVLQMKEYGFRTTVLTDTEVTTARLKQEIETVLSEGDETVVIYFAGHGEATDYGAYLITMDALTRPDDGLDLNLLDRMITARSLPDAAIITILDCCHSGGFRLGPAVSISLRSTDLLHAVQVSSERRVLLAACKDNQFADEDDRLKHGVFTHYLLDGLMGEASGPTGDVTVSALYDHVSEAFAKNHAQTPVYRGDVAGRVVLGRGLLPKAGRERKQELQAIEREARAHLQAIHEVVASSLSRREEWHARGHLTACKLTGPIIEWFAKREREHPELVSQPAFSAARQELESKTENLSKLEPGIRLDCGEIKRRLGFGSFGSVWLVEDAGKPLAVKAYHPGDLPMRDKAARFRQGFSAMRQLDHKHIVRVHSLYECPLMFSMEYINGANLRDWSGATSGAEDLLAILYTIADTLRHAHSRGVIHRDVKPENVILKQSPAGDWQPHLTDFDLAWFSTASLSTKDALGTVFYAAPEQLAKPGSASAHSPLVDVFSIGQLLYFTITGSDPVPLGMADNGRALERRLGAWGSAEPARLFHQLFTDSTQNMPSKRPQSMEEVCGRLFEIRSALRPREGHMKLPLRTFVEELRYAFDGSIAEDLHDGFLSPTGHTHIALMEEGSLLRIRLTLSRKPLIDNVGDFRKAKIILLERARQIARTFNYKLDSGSSDPFHIFVDLPVTLTVANVSVVHELLLKMVSALERG